MKITAVIIVFLAAFLGSFASIVAERWVNDCICDCKWCDNPRNQLLVNASIVFVIAIVVILGMMWMTNGDGHIHIPQPFYSNE